MTDNPWFYVGFGAFILLMLAIDLGVFHRKTHVVGSKEALTWTLVWVTLASLFGAWIWVAKGSKEGTEFFTGYLIELSLSADNVFVFALIFSFFAVPKEYQHKVLIWGVISAIIMRLIMIVGGAALLRQYSWILYVFGGFLILTGIKMFFNRGSELHPEDNPVVKWFRRAVRTTNNFEGDKLVVKKEGKWYATPLMTVLVCIEISDLIFALDSIPAIFAVTMDPFIIFTSNVFAIMGLRSLYFLLAGMMNKFHYLRLGLGAVLVFIGCKMLLGHTAYAIPTNVALPVVAGILIISVVASLLRPQPPSDAEPPIGTATPGPQ